MSLRTLLIMKLSGIVVTGSEFFLYQYNFLNLCIFIHAVEYSSSYPVFSLASISFPRLVSHRFFEIHSAASVLYIMRHPSFMGMVVFSGVIRKVFSSSCKNILLGTMFSSFIVMYVRNVGSNCM